MDCVDKLKPREGWAGASQTGVGNSLIGRSVGPINSRTRDRFLQKGTRLRWMKPGFSQPSGADAGGQHPRDIQRLRFNPR